MFESVARFYVQGGAFMWLILGLLAAALAVIAERLHFYLSVCRDDASHLLAGTAEALDAGDADRALALAAHRDAPLNAVVGAAVARYRDGGTPQEIRQAVDEAAIVAVPRLRLRLGYLATCASTATLAGLLGTIFGLQRSFGSLAVTAAAEKSALLASGIAQAMNTTAFGLIVAILCMVAHARLASLQAARLDDLDAGIVRLLDDLETRLAAPAPRTTRVSA